MIRALIHRLTNGHGLPAPEENIERLEKLAEDHRRARVKLENAMAQHDEAFGVAGAQDDGR